MEKEIVDIIKKVKITKRSKTLILDCPFGKDQVVYDLRDIKETYPNVTKLKRMLLVFIFLIGHFRISEQFYQILHISSTEKQC